MTEDISGKSAAEKELEECVKEVKGSHHKIRESEGAFLSLIDKLLSETSKIKHEKAKEDIKSEIVSKQEKFLEASKEHSEFLNKIKNLLSGLKECKKRIEHHVE